MHRISYRNPKIFVVYLANGTYGVYGICALWFKGSHIMQWGWGKEERLDK
jgi:hypothetical protein